MGAPFVFLPEQFKIVDATAGPVTTNGGVTSDYVSLKNAKYAWIVLQFTQAVGHATSIQPRVAADVSGTSAASITFAADLWQNADTATSDTLVKATSATSLALAADAKKKLVVIGIDPAACQKQGATLDCINFTISDSSQATNFVSGVFVLEMKYAQATPPAVITD